MEKYLVSARKYRPDNFKSVVGQSALTTTLQNAIKNKQLAHAYLFCGPRGVGKTTCARIFAKAINCFHPNNQGEACNKCESCVSFNEQRSYNIHELDAASNNSVDDIRSLTEQVRIPPQLGKYKVYIIDEVHMLSSSAFNAFLKTLEEPPAHAIFILATTEKHKIIPTILSRCQIYDFHRISINDICAYLQYVADSEGIETEPEALNAIALKSDGGMRDALSIFDQVSSYGEGKITYKHVIDNLNILDYDYYFRLVEAFLSENTTESLLLFDQILNQGFDGLHFINGLASHFRDLMVSKDPRSISLLEQAESVRAKYKKQAEECSMSFLFKALKLSNECSLQYNQSKNKRLLVELCLIQLCLTDEAKKKPQGLKTDNTPSPKVEPNPLPASKTQTPDSPSSPSMASNPKPATPTDSASQPNPQTGNTGESDKETRPHQQAAVPEPAPQNKNPNTGTDKERPLAGLTTSIRRRKIQAEENQSREATEKETIKTEEHFSEENLIEAWLRFAGTLKEDPYLSNSMQACKPRLLNKSDFEVVVFHPLTAQRLEAIRADIENSLQRDLQNGKIHMQLRISEENELKKPLSPQDQLDEMIKKNPNLQSLKQKLSLELQ
ncbi:MAG TPA: DNA polymerase III subunit gamma/tau [Bacteroidales bacterium]|nr:DNA polymerase III subunit gamma/tau [Bacteroidales bacterium]